MVWLRFDFSILLEKVPSPEIILGTTGLVRKSQQTCPPGLLRNTAAPWTAEGRAAAAEPPSRAPASAGATAHGRGVGVRGVVRLT